MHARKYQSSIEFNGYQELWPKSNWYAASPILTGLTRRDNKVSFLLMSPHKKYA